MLLEPPLVNSCINLNLAVKEGEEKKTFTFHYHKQVHVHLMNGRKKNERKRRRKWKAYAFNRYKWFQYRNLLRSHTHTHTYATDGLCFNLTDVKRKLIAQSFFLSSCHFVTVLNSISLLTCGRSINSKRDGESFIRL